MVVGALLLCAWAMVHAQTFGWFRGRPVVQNDPPTTEFVAARWYFGTNTENGTKVKNSLTKNGFAIVPGSFSSAARKLLTTNAPTKVGVPGQAGTGCATVVGGGA